MSVIKRFLKSDNFWVSTFRDILFAGLFVGAIALALYAYTGAWPPLVSVNGLSMDPHMHDGDLILIQKADPASIMTYDAAKGTGYQTFENYGDVLCTGSWAHGHDARHPPCHDGERVRAHVGRQRGGD
jgi:signal peptidase